MGQTEDEGVPAGGPKYTKALPLPAAAEVAVGAEGIDTARAEQRLRAWIRGRQHEEADRRSRQQKSSERTAHIRDNKLPCNQQMA